MNTFQKLSMVIAAIACFIFNAQAAPLSIETVQWVPKDDVDFSLLEPAGKENWGVDATLYVARGLHRGSLIPGKFNSYTRQAHIGYDGTELTPEYYELLVAPVGSVSWVPNVGQVVPANLIYGGIDPVTLRPLYVCRAVISGYVVVGRYTNDGGNGVCIVPLQLEEHTSTNFEVLALNVYGEYINAGRGENLKT